MISQVSTNAGLPLACPAAWDLLSALKTLAAHGYGGDARFIPLLQLVLNCQDGQGRWRCGSVVAHLAA